MSIRGWLDQDWLKTIVLITFGDNSFGTGFLVLHDRVFLIVTAKHVVVDRDTGIERANPTVHLNNQTGGLSSRPFSSLPRTIRWNFHEDQNVDLAVSVIGLDPTIDDFRLFPSEMFMNVAEVGQGDDVFFLGFPLGEGAIESRRSQLKPILRAGTVSLVEERRLLVEASVYEGSSGSPVFLKPSPFTLTENAISLRRQSARLVGVATGYIGYEGQNTNLAKVFSADRVGEIIRSPDFQPTLGVGRNQET
ncbi:MAG: serine protease [Nitrososphaerales archaeon]